MIEGIAWSEVIFVITGYVFLLLILGDSFRRIIELIAPKLVAFDIYAEAIVLDIGLGILAAPALIAFLTFFPLLFSQAVLIIVLSISAAAIFILEKNTIILEIGRIRNAGSFSGQSFIKTLRRHKEIIALSVFFILAIFIRIAPIISLYVPFGGDSRMWTFFSYRIVEEGGITLTPGRFELIDYEKEFHRFLIGLPSNAALLSILLNVPVPRTVLIVTNMMGAFSVLGIFFLVMKITHNIQWATFSSAIAGFLSYGLFDFYTWGGNGDLAVLALAPLVIGLINSSSDELSFGELLVLIGIMTLSVVFHPYAFIYISIAALSLYILNLFNERQINHKLTPLIAIAIFVVVVYLLQQFSFLPPNSNRALEESYWRWRLPVLNHNTFKGDIVSNISLALSKTFCKRWHSCWNSTLALLGFVGITFISSKRNGEYQRRGALFSLLWFAMMFLFHENHPYGLYFIEYPLYHIVFPERMILSWSLPLCFLGGGGLLFITNGIQTIRQKEEAMESNLPPKMSVILKVFAGFLIISIIGSCFMFSMNDFSHNASLLGKARSTASPMTKNDAAAFRWIIENTPENATFISDALDAGMYIPFYTNRMITPPLFQIYADIPSDLRMLSRDYLFHDPNNESAVEILNKYNIGYVYVGDTRLYNVDRRFNVTAMELGSNYDLVFSEGGVRIFEVIQSS